MVGLDSHSFSRGGCYLGNTQKRVYLFAYRALTVYDLPFQDNSAKINFCNFPFGPYTETDVPTTPHKQRTRPLTPMWFRLFPVRSPLLRKSMAFSFPGGTEMFHFPPFASRLPGIFRITTEWVVPFGNLRIKACLAAPRSFSQPATSFIAV